jgi:hypothetical protein
MRHEPPKLFRSGGSSNNAALLVETPGLDGETAVKHGRFLYRNTLIPDPSTLTHQLGPNPLSLAPYKNSSDHCWHPRKQTQPAAVALR